MQRSWKHCFCHAGRSTSSLPQTVSQLWQICQPATVFRIQNTLFYMCILLIWCFYKELVFEDMQKTKKRCIQTGQFIPLFLGQSHYPVDFRVDILKASWKLFYFFQSLLYFSLNSVLPMLVLQPCVRLDFSLKLRSRDICFAVFDLNIC